MKPNMNERDRSRVSRPPLRVVQVVTNVGVESSGPSYTVPSLARALARAGHAVELFSVAGGEAPAFADVTSRTFPRASLLRSAWRSPALRRALASAALTADVLHSHGLWLLPNLYPGWVRRPVSTPLVVSPRGTLSGWALEHARWKKKIAWAVAQGRVVAAADCLHATAEEEYRDLRRLGLKRPVCVIPNGVDVPPEGLELVTDPDAAGLARPLARRPAPSGLPGPPRVLLYIGRLHVKKGVDRLLRAWTALAPERPDWCLHIVGPDDGGHAAQLRALAAELRSPRVSFSGAIEGAPKQALYRRAALHVLPSHSENFGMTVAESLACGTPVITTQGTPWSGLVRESCGWWIELGVEPLVEALSVATALDEHELAARGARGRAWMLRDFSWDSVAEQMAAVYRWLRLGGPAPLCVRID
jgi:glycosyltransferase involved in cell wall biosynthesis